MANSTTGYLIGTMMQSSFGPSFSGNYKIEGTTVLNGQPFAARVFLLPHDSVMVIREAVTTTASNTYSFPGLAAGKYTVLAIDRTGNKNAVVYSFVTAVAM